MRTYVLAVVHAATAGVVAPIVLIAPVAFVVGYLGYSEFMEQTYVGESALFVFNLIAVYVSPALTMLFIRPYISQADAGNFLLISTLSFLILNMFMFIIPLPAMNSFVAIYLVNAFIASIIFYYRTSRSAQ